METYNANNYNVSEMPEDCKEFTNGMELFNEFTENHPKVVNFIEENWSNCTTIDDVLKLLVKKSLEMVEPYKKNPIAL